MNTASLKALKAELQADVLQVLCDGAIEVDWGELLDLQTLSDGRSLKDTDDDKILRLAESLLRFGIVNNLQVWFDENNDCYCFDAHHRRKAFEVLDGIGVEIPPLPATRCLASSKVRAMQLLLVKESKSSWVNYKVVPDYLQETGFSFKVASRVIDLPEIKWNEICEAGEDQEEAQQKADEIPEPPIEIHIKTGDLIELGANRLLCGDSTSAKDVKKLMGKENADMVFTDPPYGIRYKSNWKNSVSDKEIHGDDKYCIEWLLYVEAYEYYIFCRYDSLSIIESAIKDQKLKLFNVLVWDKLSHTSGDLKSWGNTYELIVYCGSRKSKLEGERPQNVLRIGRLQHGGTIINQQDGSMIHPTQKPVKIVEVILNKHSHELIIDPFLGSGTTMIACEKTNRRCFAMEIDPGYCQISVQRWADFTEQDEIKINGRKVSWNDYVGV